MSRTFKLLAFLFALLAPTVASAQCSGSFPANTICGSLAGGIPRALSTSVLTGIPGGSNGQVQYNNNGAFGGFTMGGDCTLTATTGVIICTKTNGVAFTVLATGTRQGNTTTFPSVSGSFTAGHSLTTDASGNIIDAGASTRTLLQADTTLYVRTVPVAVTITNASPAVVTHTSHGYLAGQLVTFNSTSSLPTGMTAGKVYCVIAAGLATNTYEFSATCGGAAINTSSAGSGTFTEQAGNDLTGDGSAQTATKAFMTIQGGINYTGQNVDRGNYVLTLQAACAGGGGVALYGEEASVMAPLVGGKQSQNTAQFIIKGDETTPDNCVAGPIAATTSGAIFSAQQYANVKFTGFALDANASVADTTPIFADTNATIWLGAVKFLRTSTNTGIADMQARVHANILCQANYTKAGNAWAHWYTQEGGFIECAGLTITLSGTPSFSKAFAVADAHSSMNVSGDTFSGSATGSRYFVANVSQINTGSGSLTYLPGNAIGTPNGVNNFGTTGADCCGLYR